MNKDTPQKIKQIINERKRNLPIVKEKIAHLESLIERIKQLDIAIRKLGQSPKTKGNDLKELVALFDTEEIRLRITENIAELETIEKRLSRSTINFGVSGRREVGKSTLLKTISGLSENEIPTGKGLPVTAVRSRIYNSAINRKATICHHSYESFRDSILAGLHGKISKHNLPPKTLDEFRNYFYPNFDEVTKQIPSEDKKNEADITNALSRLKEIKNALSSYENNFDIQDMEIKNLSELRQFVAYPTNEERINVDCPRKYLTVKDVIIECPFPNVDVYELGLIDLPGLGETDPNIEKRHVEGFKNEVDFVLVLKNPSKDAFWTNEDIQCLGLLEQAKGHFGKSGDFVAIGINTCKTNNNIDALVEDIRRKVNEGVDNKHNKVFIFDAKDLKSVHEDMLNPVLDYIAKILPNLDKELIEVRFNNINQLEQRIKRKILNFENDIKNRIPQISGADEQRHRLTENLRRNISNRLQEVVELMMKDARSQGEFAVEDAGFINNVTEIHKEINEWIKSCFGETDNKWIEDATKTIKTDMGFSKLATDQLHHIRVEISRRYCGLDPFFQNRIEALWDKIVLVFKEICGNLLPDDLNGNKALEYLYTKLEEASEECPKMCSALKELGNLAIQYRAHLHPRVRQSLDTLNFEIQNPQGEQIFQITDITINETGAKKLLQQLQELARKAAHEIRNALIGESSLIPLILHSAAEQFEDSFIRGKGIEFEFHRLTRSYRDDIWPSAFEDIDSHNICVSNINKLLKDIQLQLVL